MVANGVGMRWDFYGGGGVEDKGKLLGDWRFGSFRCVEQMFSYAMSLCSRYMTVCLCIWDPLMAPRE